VDNILSIYNNVNMKGVESMKKYVLLKNETCQMKPYHIEPSAKYLDRPPANRQYKFFGDYSTQGAAVAAMCKDAQGKHERKQP
jgi:hypothetical protein